ncbi:SBBP repeat-containing protein [Synechococcus sp. W70.1]|uniref:Vgb family protein n=1 Tax=unclassified Synechococcus TaxID=2626047 RepID=UPI0039C18BFD
MGRKQALSKVVLSGVALASSALLAACGRDPGPWSRQFGTPSSDEARALAEDGQGNVWVAGITEGSLPGQSSAGGSDVFLRKYNAQGRELWTRQFGTPASDEVVALAVDRRGNAWVAGMTHGAFPGYSNAGEEDIFLRKYDPQGRELWTQQLGSAGPDQVIAIAVDGKSNVWVAGTGAGKSFVRQYNANGKPLWVRELGAHQQVAALAADGAGNLWIAGFVRDRARTGGFVCKYDPSGNQVWMRQFSHRGGDGALSVAVGGEGKVWVAGYAQGKNPSKAYEVFAHQYDLYGNELWSRQFAGGQGERVLAIAVDGSGRIWVAGHTQGSSSRRSDAFVRLYEANGGELWRHQFGSADFDWIQAIAVGQEGNLVVAGVTWGSLADQSHAGMKDVFVRKYGR